jgi:hypothetical protein
MRARGKTVAKPPFPPEVRICTDCGQTKPVAEFVPIRKTKVRLLRTMPTVSQAALFGERARQFVRAVPGAEVGANGCVTH